jgi:hypothetical protein
MTGFVRTFAALVRDTWLEFLDSRSLWLVLVAIAAMFGVALSIRVEPRPAGRKYLDFAARALSTDLASVDLAEVTIGEVAATFDGSVAWIQDAEPLPDTRVDSSPRAEAASGAEGPATRWRVTLVRTALPVLGRRVETTEIRERFGTVADGRLWRVGEITETTGRLGGTLGTQTWGLVAEPGDDLAVLWPHRVTIFGGALDVTSAEGAPLGLEIFVLQKLLATGLGGTILLLVSVIVTAGFVPAMLRKGTLELLLARPVPRWQLIVGKFGAALLFVAGLLGVLVAATWLVTGLVSGLWNPGILMAVASLLLFFALLLAVSVCAGVVTRSAPAAMLVTVAYWAVLFIVGILHAQAAGSRVREALVGKPRPLTVADALRGRAEARRPLEPDRNPFHRSAVGRGVEAVYAVLPHTTDLDAMVDRQLMRGFAVGGRLRRLLESGEFSWQAGVPLTLVHLAGFLTVACVVFSRRDP